ncbi:Protein Ahnak2 [Manis pentadactyla]|nr:Protein Ahnak2 [Manis pentadactyla]
MRPATELRPSPSPRWRRQRRTTLTRPRLRYTSALAAAFPGIGKATLSSPSTLLPIPGSSAERLWASHLLTTAFPDFTFPPLEGGERFSFAAAASAAWSPNKAERERAAEECHITLETGGDLTPGFIEGFASEVTSTVAVVGAGIPGAQSTRGMVASDRALREPSG